MAVPPVSATLCFCKPKGGAATMSMDRRMVRDGAQIQWDITQNEIMPLAAPGVDLERITVNELRHEYQKVS